MGSPLISAAELAAELAAPSRRRPVVLDVRWDLAAGPQCAEYASGHIPDAAFVDLDVDLAASPGAGGRHPLPDPEAFAAAMRAAGVGRERPVVAYDAGSGQSAARAWWLLRYHGHPAVTVLDGGLAAWLERGFALEAGSTAGAPGDFTADPGQMPLLDARAAAELAAHGVLIDARTPERFRGEREPVDPVAGRIPGAVNRPAGENLGPDGRFLSPGALREAFAALGASASASASVGAYCGSGVSAAQEVLALELAGAPAALYAGSWSEWITDPARPVATGQP